MKKIKLDLDDLKVESFDTQPEEGEVFGYACPTCPPNYTCDPTCPNTCCDTCANTCGSTCSGATCDSTCSSTCGYTCVDTCPPRSCGGDTVGGTCPV